MSSLESSKNTAGIGTILLLLTPVPGAGIIIGIIGAILLLMGIKGLASYYQDNEIYQNTFKGLIFYVIAIIVAGLGIGGLTFGSMFAGMRTGLLGIGIGLALFIISLVVAFVFYVLAALSLRRAFSSLAQRTGQRLFETAGLLLFIGAILTIVVAGLALILVAWILATIAFFSISTPQTYGYTQPASAPQQSTPPSTATRYCPNCGAPVPPNSAFCPNCGKPLPP